MWAKISSRREGAGGGRTTHPSTDPHPALSLEGRGGRGGIGGEARPRVVVNPSPHRHEVGGGVHFTRPECSPPASVATLSTTSRRREVVEMVKMVELVGMGGGGTECQTQGTELAF